MRLSQQKITAFIQSLRYDFNHFVLRDFIVNVAQQRRRPIYIRRRDLSADLFGAWLPAADADYIYIKKNHYGVPQIHTTIHELAHILLDHPRRPIGKVQLHQRLGIEIAEGCTRCVPTMQMEQTPEEQEAEEFVFQIQEQVMRADRLRELTAAGTSIETLLPMVNTSES